MKENPFIIFPWQRAFLPDLKEWVEEKTGHNCGAASVIVPNRRPWRHLCELFKAGKKAATLPRMFTFSEVINLWQANLPARPLRLANALDQVALLGECVRDVAKIDQGLAKRFAEMEMPRFLPWGLRLANIFEELFIQGREAVDIANLEFEVDQPAAALLGALGKIGVAYREALTVRKWTTPGFSQYLAGQNARQIPRRLMPGEDRPVFIAGFANLNGTEKKILKSLWDAGAQICLHTDPLVSNAKGYHFACADHASWIKDWKAQTQNAVVVEDKTAEPAPGLFSGYDLHSQLTALAEEISQKPELSTAIVLANEDLLMPLLHQLPDKNVNISMGYPITHTPLTVLLKAVFALHQNDIGDGRHYWRDVQAITCHPYLKLLGVATENGPSFFKEVQLRVDEYIRQGGPRLRISDMEDKVLEELEGPLATLFAEFSELVFARPREIKSLKDLAVFLEDFIGFLLRNNQERWENFHLDQEVIHRISHSIIPVLRDNDIAEEELPFGAGMEVLNTLLDAERIPFTTERFDNVQILGMLETRLLNFDRVFFLDATDDVLPGTVPRDPLLPNSLRSVLGLPDSKSREKSMAYNLYRLYSGAREAHFYWQEGVNRSDVANGKKGRSRFVEQLIWQEEKKRQNILKPGDSILRVAKAPISTSLPAPGAIMASEAIRERLNALLSREISATELDTYLECPLKFAYAYLLKIRGAAEPYEDDNPLFVGSFVHKALEILFAPWLDKKLDTNKILAQKSVPKSFDQAWQTFADGRDNPSEILPAHVQLRLQCAYYANISNYIEKMPENIVIQKLEGDIKAELAFKRGRHIFKGRLDRIDCRDGKLHIVDYKAGLPPAGNPEFWKEMEFFKNAADLCAREECDFQALTESLNYMREQLPSLQLPIYMLLLASQVDKKQIVNAAFVDLCSKDKKSETKGDIEKRLFNDLDEEETLKAFDYCALCVDLALRHILETPKFEARTSRKCKYCPYNGLCAS